MHLPIFPLAEYTVGGKKKKKGGADSSYGPGGGGGKKARGAEPGPPVEGAQLRVDVWPAEVDAQGGVVGPVSAPPPLACF